jgi:hypothetical protein
MTHKQKTYLILGAAIVAVVALMLVLTNGRAEAGAVKAPNYCGPTTSTIQTPGGVRFTNPDGKLCKPTTTTTGLVPEVPGTDTPTSTSTSITTTTVTLGPSTTICRIGENGLGTYPNGESCGERPLRPVVVVAQPTYTG